MLASAAGLLILFALTNSPVQGVGVVFKDCAKDGAIGTYSAVEVSNCDVNQSNCILRKNSNATISITFTSTENLSELKAIVHGIILDVEIPFKLPNDNGCVDSGLECPLSKDTEYKYSTTLPVLKQYPKVVVNVKWELKSGDKTVVCVIIPAKIQ